jgi:YVTN family beta-propeller protein
MSLRDSSGSRPAWASRRVLIAGAAAVALAAAAATALVTTSHSATSHGASMRPGAAAAHPATKSARLAASSCTGPAGAAYIALPGYQAFDAINTANCDLVQQYNVGDTTVPGDSGDFNYSSSEQGIAIYNNTLYFGDTGNDTVAVMPVGTLTVDNYANPAETLVQVGINPTNLTVTPDGSQVWVADTGPQTGQGGAAGGPPGGHGRAHGHSHSHSHGFGQSAVTDIKVISTATNTVTKTLPLRSAPAEIAFSPDGSTAYVTTAAGLVIYSTATGNVTGFVPGLGDPHGIVVSPDGSTLYVTSTIGDKVDVISTATDRVTGSIAVGELPWGMALSSDGSTLYVANPDSNSVSVISTSSDTVAGTIAVTGDPDTLALTPDGSELWVGGLTSGIVTVFDTSNDSSVGSFNVGYGGYPNAGDGELPTAIVMTTNPPPGG